MESGECGEDGVDERREERGERGGFLMGKAVDGDVTAVSGTPSGLLLSARAPCQHLVSPSPPALLRC